MCKRRIQIFDVIICINYVIGDVPGYFGILCERRLGDVPDILMQICMRYWSK